MMFVRFFIFVIVSTCSLRATFSLFLTNKYHHLNINSPRKIQHCTLKANSVSNVNEETTTQQSVVSTSDMISAISLTAGTTVGAGILGLPSFSLPPGFIPSSLALLFSWVYMCSTGLLVAEVSTFLHKKKLFDKAVGSNKISITNDGEVMIVDDEEEDQNGIISMIDKTLGVNAKLFGAVLYVFIHYALLVAYISEAGAVLSESLLPSQFPPFAGPLLFTTSLFSLFAFGSLRGIEKVNNVFVLVVLASFLSLIGIGLPEVPLENNIALFDENYSKLITAFPVMLLALVYHNIIPTISAQLQYNRKSITTAISIGSFIPLCMFILWNFLIIGLIPPSVITDSGNTVIDPVNILITTFSSTGTSTAALSTPTALTGIGKYIPPLISVFSEAAVITSFIGFVFGLSDFFRDLFPTQFPPPHHHSHHSTTNNDDQKVSSAAITITTVATQSEASSPLSSSFALSILPTPSDVPLYSIILLPPLMISIVYPDAFTGALSLAGTYGIALLFCILPAAMALSARQMSRNLAVLVKVKSLSEDATSRGGGITTSFTSINNNEAIINNNNNNNNNNIDNSDVNSIGRPFTNDIGLTNPTTTIRSSSSSSMVATTADTSTTAVISSNSIIDTIQNNNFYQVFVPGGSIVLYSIIGFATFIILAQTISFQ